MKRIIRKAYWDYEKEEQWLNEMSAKGLALTNYTCYRYVFEETHPGEYRYKIELLSNPPSHPESAEYIKFVEETGAEYVTSYGSWVYFRKKSADGPFELYSDIESKMKHYKKIFNMWYSVAIAELVIGYSNIQLGLILSNRDMGFLAFAGAPLFLLGLLMLFGLAFPINKKIKALKKESEIRE